MVSNSGLNGNFKNCPQSPFELRRRLSERGVGGVGGGYLCIDDFHDRKYPEALTKDMRRSVFRMGSFSFKLRNFSQRSSSVPSFRVLLATKTRETIHPLDDDIQASQGEANTTAR